MLETIYAKVIDLLYTACFMDVWLLSITVEYTLHPGNCVMFGWKVLFLLEAPPWADSLHLQFLKGRT